MEGAVRILSRPKLSGRSPQHAYYIPVYRVYVSPTNVKPRLRHHFRRPNRIQKPSRLFGMSETIPETDRAFHKDTMSSENNAEQIESSGHVLVTPNFGDWTADLPTTTTSTSDSYYKPHELDDGTKYQIRHTAADYRPGIIDWNTLPAEARDCLQTPAEIARVEIHKTKNTIAEPTLDITELSPKLRDVFDTESLSRSSGVKAETPGNSDSHPTSPSEPPAISRRFLKKQHRIAEKKEIRKAAKEQDRLGGGVTELESTLTTTTGMSSKPITDSVDKQSPPAQHKPLVVGRTKPSSASMDSTKSVPSKAEINHEIEENLKSNTNAAAPAADSTNAAGKKKEKAPKQPKPPKATPPVAPLSPALIDLRVGHILRAVNHPNADSLYVSTIAMGDPEGAEHTSIDEETGKVVRTVCSGLNGLVPLAEMQDRKIIVVANLKPVNMRSIKSAAMVLAASPAMKEGDDPHAADRVVELVNPPEGAEAGDAVYFEGWEYSEGKGPEKQLNPKKKQWEAIQPGFFTSDDLNVGFDAGRSEVEGDAKGMLVVEGKGRCTVKSLKGAVVR